MRGFLESIKDSLVRIWIMTSIGFILSFCFTFVMGRYVNPKRAFIDGCVITSTNVSDIDLCQHTQDFLAYANDKTEKSLFRDGGYPIQIRFVRFIDNDKSIAGIARMGLMSCNIEISTGQFGYYDTFRDLDAVILHEIAHCYGLPHSDDENSLMYPSTLGNIKIDQINDLLSQIKTQAQ